jgi:hypothetical protein
MAQHPSHEPIKKNHPATKGATPAAPVPSEVEEDYTSDQFKTDFKKAGKSLDILREKARAEYKAGKTKSFPE